jgi:hypothetical protein
VIHQPHSISDSDRTLGDLGPTVFRIALAIGVIGLGLTVLVGALAGAGGFERFFRSYLVAFVVVTSIALGGLFFTMIQHLTRAGWSVVVRRLAEGVASNLTWIWILFIPILLAALFGWTHMYHWLHPEGDEVLIHKAPYFFWPLSYESHIPAFWMARAVIIFAVWAMLARFFVNTSIAQDASGDVNLTHRLQWYAPLGILAYAITQTLASFDWLMSLEPHWFSTIYGVYFFAASATGFFSLFVIAAYLLRRSGRLEVITHDHFQDMGKFLFAFGVVFWAYIAYSQYMLLWYANIPETSGWVITRHLGGWAGLSLFLLVGHFAGPFVILISRHTKRAVGALSIVAGWMLFMHFIDVYWLAVPTIPAEILATARSMDEVRAAVTSADINYGWHILDFMCVISLMALLVAGTAWKLSRCSLVPVQDPRLPESLAFENM